MVDSLVIDSVVRLLISAVRAVKQDMEAAVKLIVHPAAVGHP